VGRKNISVNPRSLAVKKSVFFGFFPGDEFVRPSSDCLSDISMFMLRDPDEDEVSVPGRVVRRVVVRLRFGSGASPHRDKGTIHRYLEAWGNYGDTKATVVLFADLRVG
jgi:hypothetical protein